MRRIPAYVVFDGGTLTTPECRSAVANMTAGLASIDGVVSGVTRYGSAGVIAEADIAGADAPQAALGAALRRFNAFLGHETRPRTVDHRGDYQPLLFVLATEEPSDDWLPPSLALRTLVDLRLVNVIGIAFSPEAASVCLSITSVVYGARLEPAAFREACLWIVRTVETAARLAGRASAVGKMVMPPALPPSLMRIG